MWERLPGGQGAARPRASGPGGERLSAEWERMLRRPAGPLTSPVLPPDSALLGTLQTAIALRKHTLNS